MKKMILGVEMDIDLPEVQGTTNQEVISCNLKTTATPATSLYNSLYIEDGGEGEGVGFKNVTTNSIHKKSLAHEGYIANPPELPEYEFLSEQDITLQGFTVPATSNNEANQPQSSNPDTTKNKTILTICTNLDRLVRKTGKPYADCLDEAYALSGLHQILTGKG